MKTKTTVIFALVVFAVAVAAFALVPTLFPKETASSSVIPTSSAPPVYTPAEAIAFCDTVITGTVIKADVVEDGVQYTMQVGRVYKGRNYTSMGYAFVKGPQTLKIATTYLFIGVTGTQKYHYYEPFIDAPWVYEITDQTVTSHASNGDVDRVNGMVGMTLEQIKEICDRQKTSSQ